VNRARLIALALVTALVTPSGAATGERAACGAFLLRGVLDPATGGSLAEKLHLDPDGIYLLKRGARDPVRVDVRDEAPVREVALSPRGDRIAYTVLREISCDPSYGWRLPFLVVIDTTGAEIAAVPGVARFAWAPDGERLAIVYGRPDAEGGASDSLGVLDVGSHAGTTYPLRPAFVSWLDPHTLFLDRPGVVSLDLSKGKWVTRQRVGGFVSPDERYSFTVAGPTKVGNDWTHADLTKPIEALLEGGRLESPRPPFWVQGAERPHVLCITTATPGAIYLVDVQKREVVRKIAGAGIAATPDAGAIIVYRDGQFVFEDL